MLKPFRSSQCPYTAINGAVEEEDSAVKAEKNQATAKSNFAALSLEDDESEEEISQPAQAKPKGKGKKKQTGGFAALELEDDDPELDAGEISTLF